MLLNCQNFCCDNLWQSILMALEKPGKLGGIFFSYFVATLNLFWLIDLSLMLALDSRHDGSNASFTRSPFLIEESMRQGLWLGLPPHHIHFTALIPGPPGWAGARRELLHFMVQGKINRDRNTNHPAGHHSIQTNQCPPPPSPIFLQAGCPSCRPTNSVKALKATSAHSN